MVAAVLTTIALMLVIEMWQGHRGTSRNVSKTKTPKTKANVVGSAAGRLTSSSKSSLDTTSDAALRKVEIDDMGFCSLAKIAGDAASGAGRLRWSADYAGTSTAPVSTLPPSSFSSSSLRSGDDEENSPLCVELREREALGDMHLSARVCRYLSRQLSSSSTRFSSSSSSSSLSSPPPSAVAACGGRRFTLPHLVRACGAMLTEEEAPKERSVNPYSRDAPFTYFLWNKGLAASCDVSPAQMVDDTWEFPADDYLQALASPTPPKVLYVVTSQYTRFSRSVLSQINYPFVLVTGSADYSAPFMSGTDGVLEAAKSVLNHPFLIAWFAQNCDMVHPKMVPIPIGIDYHTIAVPSLTEHSWGIPTSAAAQDALLQELRCTLPPFLDRPLMAIMNFKAGGRDIRGYVHELLRTVPGVKEVGGLHRADLWRAYGGYSFVISPRGYGKDCHRTWEALVLGCAVLVGRDHHLSPLYDDLPVIQIEDWSYVNEGNMTVWKADLAARWHTFRWEKLRMSFWRDAIARAARSERVDNFWEAVPFRNNPKAFSHGRFLFPA
jgi:hypothetical protein